MSRTTWTDLPPAVRAAVTEHTGKVLQEVPTEFGARSNLTSTLHTEQGPVFVKAARTDSPFIGGLRNEAAVNPYVTHLAAPLLWTVEADGWLLLAFQELNGRHGFYTPGSQALDALTHTLHVLFATPCPPVVTKPVSSQWRAYAPEDELAQMDGESLLHTDLNPANLVLGDQRAYLVDWAWASRGAPWVEIALLIPRLINYGHTPEQAEIWACQFQAWKQAPPEAVDSYLKASLRRWETSSHENPTWLKAMTSSSRHWATYRNLRLYEQPHPVL